MKNLILLGPPGSGKGTQGDKLSKELKIPTISTGDALRAEVKAESEVGKLAKSYIDSGKLVPDEVVLNIVKNRISQDDCENGFILDGFPRNNKQAEMLDLELKKIDKKIDQVLNFEVPDEEIIKRISGRYFCKKCGAIYNKFSKKEKVEGVCDECGSDEFFTRSDDNEDTIKNRLKIYHEETATLQDYYQKKGLIFSFSGIKSSALLFEELLKNIKEN